MLDDSIEEITDPTSDLETSSDTLKDAEQFLEQPSFAELIDEFIEDDQISKSYKYND